MTTHPKREYTPEEIEEIAQWAEHLADPIRFADPKPAKEWPGDTAAKMLRSLAAQLAAQKLEGERKPGVYSELWVSIMNARDAYERTEGNYRDPKSRTILRKQCRMISEFLRSCDPLLAIQPPSPNQDREVSP